MNTKFETEVMNLEVERKVTVPVILHLLQDCLLPGQRSLSNVFGWHQPKHDNEIVYLGTVYGRPTYKQTYPYMYRDSNNTLRGLLKDTTIGYTAAKELIQKYGITHVQKDWNAYYGSEVDVKFNELTSYDKVFYKLAVAFVNTFGKCHNWAVEFLEYLATSYASYSKNEWKLEQDDSCNKFFDELEYYGIIPEIEIDNDYDYPDLSQNKTVYINPYTIIALFPDDFLVTESQWYMGYLQKIISTIILEFSEVFNVDGIDWKSYDMIHPFNTNDPIINWDNPNWEPEEQ